VGGILQQQRHIRYGPMNLHKKNADILVLVCGHHVCGKKMTITNRKRSKATQTKHKQTNKTTEVNICVDIIRSSVCFDNRNQKSNVFSMIYCKSKDLFLLILQEWIDEKLRWDNESEFKHIQVLRIPCDLIWLPDIVLYNRLAI
jgi:hypothetical protein